MGCAKRGGVFVGRAIKAGRPVRVLASKIGGKPIGIASEQWPVCRECGRRMDFLLQLDLARPVQLSRRYAFAYIFMCHGYIDEKDGRRCATYLADAVANRVVLVESPQAGTTPGHLGVQQWPEYSLEFAPHTPPRPEPQSIGLNQRLVELITNAMDNAEEGEDVEVIVPDEMQDRPDTVLVGGEPQWVQNDHTPSCPVCGGRMRFLAQIDSEVERPGWGAEKAEWNGYLPFAGGVAYAFICEKECSPDGACVLWQCT